MVSGRLASAPPNDAAQLMHNEPGLIRVRGEILSTPERGMGPRGLMRRFDLREPAIAFDVGVESMVDSSGTFRTAQGRLRVFVQRGDVNGRIGDDVEVFGMFAPPRPPLNPGEIDRQRLMRMEGRSGFVTVEHTRLVDVVEDHSPSLWTQFLRWRDRVRRDLIEQIPTRGSSVDRDALLVAMLLGDESPDLAEVEDSFRRTGLTHLIAISGFNLVVLAGTVVWLVRLGRTPRRWHGVLMLAVVCAYLIFVRPETPVLRAGVMTICAGLSIGLGRRWSGLGIISLSAVVLLLWRPQDLFNPGFQLSFAVVYALVLLQPRVVTWMMRGPPTWTWRWCAGLVAKQALAAAIVAWLIAAPITAYHFGMISPVGVVGTLVSLPVASAVLAIGYVRLILLIVAAPVAHLLDGMLGLLTGLFIGLIQSIDLVPFGVINLPKLSAVVACAAVAGVAMTLGTGRRELRVAGLMMVGATVLITVAAKAMPRWSGSLRMDMIAVGDGSCYVVRSGGSTVVYDAGSGHDSSAGRRSIVPVLRELGVVGIDAVIVSHPNLDHFMAVPDLVAEFGVGRLIVTDQFLKAADQDADGAAAFMLDHADSRGIEIEVAAAGRVERFGNATWTWIHPRSPASFKEVNDSSQVVSVEFEGRSILLCGDIGPRAIESIMRDGKVLGADILELPHHGSFNAEAEGFVKFLDPEVVLQSTGPRRMQRDRWQSVATNGRRWVTCRDGAVSVVIWPDGAMKVKAFRDAGSTATLPARVQGGPAQVQTAPR